MARAEYMVKLSKDISNHLQLHVVCIMVVSKGFCFMSLY